MTNNATSVGSRPSVARVLVELDVTKRFPGRVWLGSDKLDYIQHVEMESFPSFCDHYKSLVHFRIDCYKLNPPLTVNPVCTMADDHLIPHVMGDVAGSEQFDSLAIKDGNNVTTHDVTLDLVSKPISVNFNTSNVEPMDNIGICIDVINTGDVDIGLNAKDVLLNLDGFSPNVVLPHMDCPNDPLTCLNGEIEPTVVSGSGRQEVPIAGGSSSVLLLACLGVGFRLRLYCCLEFSLFWSWFLLDVPLRWILLPPFTFVCLL
ncbi:hypothetical protein M5K25_024441 [Dendrobium thyrsiflorum]|uniref:Uncharacterized protein n=1 Tax=Dendrobium thyrsiflorum TaxID=117978 RepID=A0ABD0U1V7_DENTH